MAEPESQQLAAWEAPMGPERSLGQEARAWLSLRDLTASGLPEANSSLTAQSVHPEWCRGIQDGLGKDMGSLR